MITENLLIKYKKRRAEIPAPGGNGCHSAIMGVANLGVMAGLPPEEIFEDIRHSIPPGTRRVSDREIQDAIRRAISDHGGSVVSLTNVTTYSGFVQQKKESLLNDGKAVLNKIISQSSVRDEADIFENSPVRIDWPPNEDPAKLLSILYNPPDLLFAGRIKEPGILGKNINKAADWIDIFDAGGVIGPHIIPNPLNGTLVEKKRDDGPTLRGDKNIIRFRFLLRRIRQSDP